MGVRFELSPEHEQRHGADAVEQQLMDEQPHADGVERDSRMLGLPAKQGLYDPDEEKDSCGVGYVCHIKGKAPLPYNPAFESELTFVHRARFFFPLPTSTSTSTSISGEASHKIVSDARNLLCNMVSTTPSLQNGSG